MKQALLMTLLGLALAGCGADGEPVQPSVNTSVTLSSSGVSAATGVTLRTGPLSIGLSL